MKFNPTQNSKHRDRLCHALSVLAGVMTAFIFGLVFGLTGEDVPMTLLVLFLHVGVIALTVTVLYIRVWSGDYASPGSDGRDKKFDGTRN